MPVVVSVVVSVVVPVVVPVMIWRLPWRGGSLYLHTSSCCGSSMYQRCEAQGFQGRDVAPPTAIIEAYTMGGGVIPMQVHHEGTSSSTHEKDTLSNRVSFRYTGAISKQ